LSLQPVVAWIQKITQAAGPPAQSYARRQQDEWEAWIQPHIAQP
jgi:hypothetical protein